MQAQSPPAKIARFADHTEMGLTGTGGGDSHSHSHSQSQSQSQSQPVGLDLGLGPGLTTPHGRCRFTLLQMQELEHQALIFKYMAAGIPVPSHLVLPIWKSFVSSYSGAGIYPSFLGCSGVCFDYRNSMEPEPGRCRRTDGKKWRCSKDVVPDQKYCERHMHRGRGNRRSRKPVETTTITTPSSQISGSTTSRHNNVNASNTNIPVAVPLQLMTPTTNNNSTITATNNSSYSNVYPTLGFSPKSVLQTKAESCL